MPPTMLIPKPLASFLSSMVLSSFFLAGDLASMAFVVDFASILQVNNYQKIFFLQLTIHQRFSLMSSSPHIRQVSKLEIVIELCLLFFNWK